LVVVFQDGFPDGYDLLGAMVPGMMIDCLFVTPAAISSRSCSWDK
jgi:hypothetical protein